MHVSSRTIDEERNEAARVFVRTLIDDRFAGRAVDAARAFGVSGAMLSDFLNSRRGAGMKLLDGVAAVAGKSIDEILGRSGAQVAAAGAVSFEGLTGWPEAVTEARRRSALPAWTFVRAGKLSGIAAPDPITPDFAIAAATFIMAVTPRHDAPADPAPVRLVDPHRR